MNHTLLIIIVALVLSALFSGMEIAFVSSDKLRFEMESGQHTLASKILGHFFHNPNLYISTILVGNNIALVVYSTMMAHLIESFIPADLELNSFLLVVVETLVSTAIVIVLAEFVPKTFFRVNPNAKLNFFAVPIYLVYIILFPISKFTTWLAHLILKMFGLRVDKEKSERAFSKVDLDYFLQSGLAGAMDDAPVDSEVQIFQNVLDFSNVKIRDCMVPRNEICAVEKSSSIDLIKDAFIQTGYSKLIIYNQDMDHVIGYLHSSELFRHKEDWLRHIQKMPFVPETMPAAKLMKQLMARKKSLAVVIDEFGGTAGIVSLEDIIEEILGEIEDEHDTTELTARKTDTGYLLSGRLEIDRVNSMFGLHIPESEEYMTVGGLIINRTGGFPKVSEKIDIDDYSFKILKRGDTKIELVELSEHK